MSDVMHGPGVDTVERAGGEQVASSRGSGGSAPIQSCLVREPRSVTSSGIAP